jgi:alkanesulfonate monooxygenase SsuD/methylene tetrahydromethanopterin reductase-like flavin-dependent oxidoreductase (luciferase family)
VSAPAEAVLAGGSVGPTQPLGPFPRDFHLGFFTHVHGGQDATALYRGVVELFVAAEELGYDSGWVAQHHFHAEHGRLPSPLVLLAAAAERTRRIELGTAIVTLPLEDPLRLAEDVAVLDALCGGRLQLGLGSGAPIAAEFGAFGQDINHRRVLFDEKVRVLEDALAGKPLGRPPDRGRGEVGDSHASVLQPVSGGLPGRLWSSTTRTDEVGRAARAGHGLLLGVGPAGTVQQPLAAAHAQVWAEQWPGRPAPIAAVRGVFPGPDRDRVAGELAADVALYLPHHVAAGWAPHAHITTAQLLELMNVQYGRPDQIVASLAADPVFAPYGTHLVAAIQAESSSLDQARYHLEVLAREIAPALGWRPGTGARGPAAQHLGDNEGRSLDAGN